MNLEEIFNEIPVEVELHSSFVKKKFKDNMHKVQSFEHMRIKMKQAKGAVDHDKQNLSKCYEILVGSYNELCRNI